MQGFPFVIDLDVRFRDLDALGHVNNAVYLTYFEQVRLAYYVELTGRRSFDMILAETTVTYHLPAQLGDRLRAGARVASFGTKSFVMEYAIERASDGQRLTSGRSVLVMYDYAAGRSVPVSAEFRDRVATYQGGAALPAKP